MFFFVYFSHLFFVTFHFLLLFGYLAPPWRAAYPTVIYVMIKYSIIIAKYDFFHIFLTKIYSVMIGPRVEKFGTNYDV